MPLPRFGRARDASPGILISGIVIVAAAVLADAFGDPPRGGPRVVPVLQGRGLARLAFALGRAATRARVDCLHTQYFAPLGYRGPLILAVHDRDPIRTDAVALDDVPP